MEINNNIGSDIKVTFYHENKKIGECTNVLAFFDALCQIKSEGSNKYHFTTIKEYQNGTTKTFKYEVDGSGRISPASQNGIMLWNDILHTQMLYIDGFKRNFFYK